MSDSPSATRFSDPATLVQLRGDGVAWRAVFDEVIALNTESNQYHALNATGRALWETLDGGCTVGDLVARLTRDHPAAAPRAADDVARFLDELSTRQLIESVPPAP